MLPPPISPEVTMRIQILEDVATVGRFYRIAEIAEVQEPLAMSLIKEGKAVAIGDSAVVPASPVIPVPKVETAPEVKAPAAKKPAAKVAKKAK